MACVSIISTQSVKYFLRSELTIYWFHKLTIYVGNRINLPGNQTFYFGNHAKITRQTDKLRRQKNAI